MVLDMLDGCRDLAWFSKMGASDLVADPEISKGRCICVLSRPDFENSLIFVDYVINVPICSELILPHGLIKVKKIVT